MTSLNRATCFGRSHRLLNAKDFKNVFDGNNRRASHQHLLILALYKPLTATGSSRLGIVISKKNVRRATDRNRIKRVVREYFRLCVVPSNKCADFVVLVRQGIAELENQAITAILKSRFDRIRHSAPEQITSNEKAS